MPGSVSVACNIDNTATSNNRLTAKAMLEIGDGDTLKLFDSKTNSVNLQFFDDLVKLEILVNDEPVDALATIVHRNDAYHKGQAIISKLKEVGHA